MTCFRLHGNAHSPRAGVARGLCGFQTPALTYSRAWRHYHGPRVLNGRVRDGNGCGHPGVRAGSIKKVAVRVGSLAPEPELPGAWGPPGERGIGAVKRLAVSTGRLRRSPAVHLRPIDPVVYREPSALRPGDLVLRGVSRLDAFSVYPGRTLATQRCRERDNWHTRGTSLPILSY